MGRDGVGGGCSRPHWVVRVRGCRSGGLEGRAIGSRDRVTGHWRIGWVPADPDARVPAVRDDQVGQGVGRGSRGSGFGGGAARVGDAQQDQGGCDYGGGCGPRQPDCCEFSHGFFTSSVLNEVNLPFCFCPALCLFRQGEGRGSRGAGGRHGCSLEFQTFASGWRCWFPLPAACVHGSVDAQALLVPGFVGNEEEIASESRRRGRECPSGYLECWTGVGAPSRPVLGRDGGSIWIVGRCLPEDCCFHSPRRSLRGGSGRCQ